MKSKTPNTIEQLRDKYSQERNKRLREDYEEHLVDPYNPVRVRKSLTDETEVVIIGGGFSGLMAAVRIKEAGINDIRIIDQAGDFGGTWYWNRYPGAQCDIDAYIYLPLLEELGYIPKSRYSDSPEIFAHCQEIGKHYGLYENACFHTKVVELEWLEEDARWIISTDRQDRMKARYICLADGPLTQPKLPGIRGIEDFKGHIFHTSRWDYDYTGGSPEGDLSGLQDRSVAISRNRCNRDSMYPLCRKILQTALCFSTNSFINSGA